MEVKLVLAFYLWVLLVNICFDPREENIYLGDEDICTC
jgi:hypothetical protein